jgi:hypothetical protein
MAAFDALFVKKMLEPVVIDRIFMYNVFGIASMGKSAAGKRK